MRVWSGKEVEEAVMDHFKKSIKMTRNFTKPISRDQYYPTGFESGYPPSKSRTVYFQFRRLALSWLGIKVSKLQVIRIVTPNIQVNSKSLPQSPGFNSPRNLSEHDILSLKTWFFPNTATNTSHFALHGFPAWHGTRTVHWFSEW